MKVVPIEIAEKVEKSVAAFLAKEGGGLQAKFTRFIDLGGSQVDLYVYPRRERASPACVIRLKSTQSDEQEDCIQYFVDLPASEKRMGDVLVSPKADDLPSLCERIVAFAGDPLLAAIRAGEEALPEGATSSDSEEKSALSKAVE